MNCAKTVTTAREDVTPSLMYGRAAAITPFHVQVSRWHLTLHYFCLICLIFNSKHDAVVACSRGFWQYRLFSHDVTAAIFVYKTMNRRPCLCTKKILWEVNSFHMLKLSFIPSILQSCWPRDLKRSIGSGAKVNRPVPIYFPLLRRLPLHRWPVVSPTSHFAYCPFRLRLRSFRLRFRSFRDQTNRIPLPKRFKNTTISHSIIFLLFLWGTTTGPI